MWMRSSRVVDDLTKCGGDLAKFWMRPNRMWRDLAEFWMRSIRVVDDLVELWMRSGADLTELVDEI
jgi:hypothetical protein